MPFAIRTKKHMRKASSKSKVTAECAHGNDISREKERANAKLRHFRGVAASVLNDSLKVWQEIWNACQEDLTCEEIIEGSEKSKSELPLCGWQEFKEKLFLLGHYLDYSKRLCEGSVENEASGEEESEA